MSETIDKLKELAETAELEARIAKAEAEKAKAEKEIRDAHPNNDDKD